MTIENNPIAPEVKPRTKTESEWRSYFAKEGALIPPGERIKMVQRDALNAALRACKKPGMMKSQYGAGFDDGCKWSHQDISKLLYEIDHPEEKEGTSEKA